MTYYSEIMKLKTGSSLAINCEQKKLRVVLSALDCAESNSDTEICNHVTMWQFGKARCLCHMNRFNILFYPPLNSVFSKLFRTTAIIACSCFY